MVSKGQEILLHFFITKDGFQRFLGETFFVLELNIKGKRVEVSETKFLFGRYRTGG